MKLVFTEHSLKRIKERDISFELILNTIENGQKQQQDTKIVYQLITQIGNKEFLIRVICKYVNWKRIKLK